MKLDLKKLLLAGTAIVAVGATPLIISPAHAADELVIDADDSGVFDADEVANDPFDWGAVTNGGGAAGEATDGHDVQVDASATITVVDGDTIGESANNAIAIQAGANALTLTIDQDGTPGTYANVTVDGDIDRNGNAEFNLTVNGFDDADGNDGMDLDINGSIDLGTGVLTVTADDDTAENDVSLLISGDLTAASVSLDDGLSDAVLYFDGTVQQTVSGTIDGADVGEGYIGVANAAGVIFADDIGTAANTLNSINIGSDGVAGVNAEFQGDVATANGLIIGDVEATTTVDTVTVTFDATGAGTTIGGTVDSNGSDTADVIISGNDIVTASDAWGGTNGLNSVSLTETSTLDVDTSLAATTITVGDGTTLEADGTINATTITVGGGTSGVVNADAAVTATTLNIAAGAAFNTTVSQTLNANFTGDGDIDLGDGADWTGTINNTSGGDGVGNLTLNTTGANAVSGAVGATNTLNTIDVVGTGTTTFGSTVAVDDITYTGTGTLEFDGALTVTNAVTFNAAGTLDLDASATVPNIDFNGNAGTVDFADNVNLTGAIVGGAGTVDFAGTSTVSGAITAADVNINGGAGETVTLTGLVTSTNIDIDGAGTVQSNGGLAGAVNFGADGTLRLADGGDITGAITATTLGEGTLIIEGNADIDAFGTDGNELNVFTILGTGNVLGVGGAFHAANTNNIGGNTINVAGGAAVDVDAGQVLNFAITGATAAGQLSTTGAVTIDEEAVLNIDVATGDAIADGTDYVLIDGGAGNGVEALTTTITDNSYLVDFVQLTGADADNDNDLVVEAQVASTSSAATTTNNASVATALDGLGTTTNTQLAAIKQNLAAASTQQAVNDVLEATQPTVDAGNVASVVSVTNQSLNVLGTRLASLRDGSDTATGMYAGNGMYGTKVWAQAFGSVIEQDARDGVDGYDADTLGLALGVDTGDRLEGMTIGLAGSYANTDVDSDNVNATETEIDSWQIAAYADYDLTDTAFLDVMIGYAYNDIESNRYNVGGVSGLTAKGDSDGNQYFARAEVGNAYMMKDLNGVTLTPTALLNYIHVDQDGYTETGAGGANLVVNPDDMDILELGVSLEASWKKQLASGGWLKPAAHVGYRYDVIGDDAAATSQFTGGGATFKTEGFDPAQSTFNAGFGATVYNTNNWEFTGGYDFEYKSDYSAHSGVVKATYKF